MRAVVQRVARAEVRVADEVVGRIGRGLLVLVGAATDDTDEDLRYTADKVLGLRVFADEAGLMNRAVDEAGGSLLVVSQFTLLGDCRKGRRPAFVSAMAPAPAQAIYEALVARLREIAGPRGVAVETGRFRADMQVELVNDGPVTLLLDSRKLF